jgi:dipeptidyl aminopeptidase/acylaminoacyl peptidase
MGLDYKHFVPPGLRVQRLIVAALIVATPLFAVQAQPGAGPSPMTPTDILRVANVSDAQISPNGQWVVYTVATVAGDKTINTLWLARVDSGLVHRPTSSPQPTSPQNRPGESDWPSGPFTPAPLLAADWNASNPRWSPDGAKIAFLVVQENQPELWVVSLEKREPRFIAALQSTNFFITYAGESFAWAPDSKRIAYISATEELPSADLGNGTQATGSVDPRIIDRIQYKTRTSFSDNRRTHVWVTAVDKPEPQQLTSGLYYDHAITFSPSGDEIAFVSNREADPDANNNSDIFAVDLHGEVRQITQTKGCEYEPAWSPDGKWIAYTATKRDVTTIDSIAEDAHVWVTNAAGSNRRELTAGLDRRTRNPRWSANGRTIFFLAGSRGQTLIHRVELDSGKVHALFDFERIIRGPTEDVFTYPNFLLQITGFSVSTRGNSRLGLTLAGETRPAEVWVGDSEKEICRPVSGHNSFLRSLTVIAPEEINFKSFDGTRVQGWVMKPIGWRADRKYPLILSIHGGPHGMSGYAFNSTFQVYAARGYAVLYLNPRGSSGYGQKFSDGTLNEWGGGDYKDLMVGVDEALRKYSWIDQNRLGVTGGSYGGFMTNWIITQTPRFKAAVSAASVSNLISFYSTSIYQDLIHAEFGGFPWDNYDLLWQWSPLRYVKQAQTPTLFIHGEQDNDVHITQAEEMYTALKRRGVESVLVRYPREGHGLREPKHRVDALERTLAWFDRYLK